MITIVKSIQSLQSHIRQYRQQGKTIGCVPTMGALHEGHGALVTQALSETDIVVTSIFVNPKQFAAHEDLDRYPRPLEQDAKFLNKLGCHILFCPDQAEIYAENFMTSVNVSGSITQDLEAAIRPHFFKGVATIVMKLLMIIMPNRAYFGEKDYQQLCVIRQMVKDLSIPVAIESVKTIREQSGLAQSSRNCYLPQDDYDKASLIFKVLTTVAQNIQNDMPVNEACQLGIQTLYDNGFSSVDYLTLRDAFSLKEPHDKDTPQRLLIAAHLNNIRLIDNIAFSYTGKSTS